MCADVSRSHLAKALAQSLSAESIDGAPVLPIVHVVAPRRAPFARLFCVPSGGLAELDCGTAGPSLLLVEAKQLDGSVNQLLARLGPERARNFPEHRSNGIQR